MDVKAQEYSQQHQRFLEQHRPDVWRKLPSSDRPSYLYSVGSQASDRFHTLMSQYEQSPEVKDLPYLQKVQALQSRRHEADEIVRDELIYQPLKED